MASHTLWKMAAGGWAMAIAIGSLMPGDDLPSHLPWDKLQHGLGYGVLAALLYAAGLTRLQALMSAFVFGVAIEYGQCLVPGRMGGDWEDILANTLGALAGLVLATIIRLYRQRR
ncbi:VanZ family protein [Larsenimonas rhizosphaerae]|uniref:VanZ family protein n=1 Tax=Larsenimonas rhizosphaerae TaxID=2944682 RepID=A0AA42CUC2_9GAMM|nr:VanZ family protein [Larsenimonas rhizosphaerae]MCX2524149.1 VanZ family protein [Larsenimonas rhizosphaerae]